MVEKSLVSRQEAKIRELESKLEFEKTQVKRLEVSVRHRWGRTGRREEVRGQGGGGKGHAAPPDVPVYSLKIETLLYKTAAPEVQLKFLCVPDLRASVPGFLSAASVTRRRKTAPTRLRRRSSSAKRGESFFRVFFAEVGAAATQVPHRSGGIIRNAAEPMDFPAASSWLPVLRWGGTCPPPPAGPSLFLLPVSFDPRTCRECSESTSETVYRLETCSWLSEYMNNPNQAALPCFARSAGIDRRAPVWFQISTGSGSPI